MKRLSRQVRKWKWGRYVIFIWTFAVFILLVSYPGLIAEALQAVNTATAQPAVITSTASESPTPTFEPQGQVGANAGLVCGAGILVLIIVAGLMWSARWMQLRGEVGKGEAE